MIAIILLLAIYFLYRFIRLLSNISDFGMPYPFGKRVFKVKLLSVTPDIKVYKNFTKTQNITSSPKKVVTELMIQRSLIPFYYREIITGKLIPSSKYFVTDEFISHPVYIQKLKFFDKNYEEVKDYQELIKYVEERQNGYKEFYCSFNPRYNSFKGYLNMIFEKGEKYYNDSKAKNEISDSKKIACMLKQKI